MVAGDGSARAIAWPGVGASHRSMHEAKVELLQVPRKSS
jgi:hypothetical protein